MLTVVSLVATINGLLTWIGRGFGITELTLQLILRYIFYPVTFFMGLPRNEILRVAELLATKLVANEFVAYTCTSPLFPPYAFPVLTSLSPPSPHNVPQRPTTTYHSMANQAMAIPLPEEDFFVLGTILGTLRDNRQGVTWRDVVKVSRKSIATL